MNVKGFFFCQKLVNLNFVWDHHQLKTKQKTLSKIKFQTKILMTVVKLDQLHGRTLIMTVRL